jgi:DNA-binding MarR family transcriptional regulator
MTDPASADELDVEYLARAIEDFNSVFIRLASVDRLSFSALSVIHSLARVGPMRITDLVATEQIKQSALTTLVAKLETQGLVLRRPDPTDGRAVLVSLTEAGEHVARSRHKDRVSTLSGLVSHLDEHDRHALAETARVFARLREISRNTEQPPRGRTI